MTVAIVYVLPLANARVYNPMARRFAIQYMNNPPGETNHELYVCINGGSKVSPEQERLFDPLVPKFFYHNNAGKDIGAFVMAAHTIPCDLLVCCGSPTRPRMAGWLDLMVRAVENHGPGLYGCWGFHVPAVHIRTTVFAITPQLLKAYPHTVSDDKRYFFEHSHDSITLWLFQKGFQVCQVTRRGVFPIEQFHHVEQQDCLFLDQHCSRLGWVDEGSGW